MFFFITKGEMRDGTSLFLVEVKEKHNIHWMKSTSVFWNTISLVDTLLL